MSTEAEDRGFAEDLKRMGRGLPTDDADETITDLACRMIPSGELRAADRLADEIWVDAAVRVWLGKEWSPAWWHDLRGEGA